MQKQVIWLLIVAVGCLTATMANQLSINERLISINESLHRRIETLEALVLPAETTPELAEEVETI